jgi:hypothetical protein
MKNLLKELFDLFRSEHPEEGTKDHKLEFQPRDIDVTVENWDGENGSGFVKVIKEIFSLLGVDVLFAVPHGKNQSPKENDKINIWVWSSMDGKRKEDNKPPETLWGNPVDCRDTSFLPTQSKKNVIYDGSYAVAELVDGNNLYIFHDVVHKGTKNELAIFRKILEETVKMISPDVFQEILKIRAEKEREKALKEQLKKDLSTKRLGDKYHEIMKKHYVNICSARLEKEIESLKEEIDEGKETIRKQQEELIEKIREIQDLEKRMLHINSDKKVFKKELESEFTKLLQVPNVLNVITNEKDGLVEVYTDTLYCTDPRTKIVHEIGKFKISISQANGLRWENLTRRVDGCNKNQMAPHIWESGKACLGNMESIFPELIANYEYSVVVQLAIQFVESVNVDDSAGKHISNWPVKI